MHSPIERLDSAISLLPHGQIDTRDASPTAFFPFVSPTARFPSQGVEPLLAWMDFSTSLFFPTPFEALFLVIRAVFTSVKKGKDSTSLGCLPAVTSLLRLLSSPSCSPSLSPLFNEPLSFFATFALSCLCRSISPWSF